MIGHMGFDDMGDGSFEDKVRAIAREVSRSVERMAELDIGEIADAIGVDAARARELADTAARWLAGQTERAGEEAPFLGALLGRAGAGETPRTPGPHPLDLPTAEQGRALSALESGRWTVEPGSNVLRVHGEGPAPVDGLGLTGELRARDWINADGEVTLVGRHALSRWMESANSG
jgi:hypothetical protein